MTGPGHYAEAERLIGYAEHNEDLGIPHTEILAAAQVHATLALTAATALCDADRAPAGPEYRAWREAAGTAVTP